MSAESIRSAPASPPPPGRGVRTLHQVAIYGAAQVGQALLALVLVAVLARAMGKAGFGQFSLAFVIASLGGLIADFGLGPWLTRAVAQSPRESGALLRRVLGLRLRLLVLAWGVTLAGCALYLHDPYRVGGVAVMLGYLSLSGTVVIFESLLMGRGFVGRVSVSASLGRGLEVAAGALWVTLGGRAEVPYVAAAIGAGCLLRLGLVAQMSRVAIVRAANGEPIGDAVAGPAASAAAPLPGADRAFLLQVLPFALGAWMWTAYFKADVLILERLSTPAGLGLYTAAYRVIEALLLVPRTVVGVTYPLVAAAWSERTLGANVLAPPGRLLTLVSLGAAAGLWVLSRETMAFLFGGPFAEGAAVLRVLALCVPVLFLNQYLGMMFPATHRQNEWVALLGAALVVNVAANLVLIPRLDFVGAAWATLISEAFTLVIYAVLVTRRHAAVLTPGWLIRAVFAAAAMGIGVQRVPGPFFARIAVGVVLFAALSLLLGAVTGEDRAMGRALLRRLAGRPLAGMEATP